MGVRIIALVQVCILCVAAEPLWAQDNLLKDVNNDGQIFYMGFGDSITYGKGDGTQPGQHVPAVSSRDSSGGYVSRLGAWLGIIVRNAGMPGEMLTQGGVHRFPSTVQSTSADIIGIMEGVNDAFIRADADVYEDAYQRMVNVSVALGRQPLLLTAPIPCCSHGGIRLFVGLANDQMRNVAALNGVPLVAVDHAWATTCENKEACELFCLPDGLHPNTKGYDVMAQTVAATLLGIDIFAPDGAQQLEGALGWAAGTVIVKPEAN